MSKYEVLSKVDRGWVEGNPTKELSALLDTMPSNTISLHNEDGEITLWRVKPRDEQLLEEIRHLVSISPTATRAAKYVYDLLEQKGLV